MSLARQTLGNSVTANLGQLPMGLYFATSSHYDEATIAKQIDTLESAYDGKTQMNKMSLNASMGSSQCWKDSSSTFMTIRSDTDSDMQQDD